MSNSNTNSKYYLKKVDLDTFNDFALSFRAPKSMWNASYMQSKAMGEIALTTGGGYNVNPLILYKGDTPCAGGIFYIIPAMKIFRAARCLQGPLIDFSNYKLLKSFTEALVEYFRKERVISIQIQPNTAILDENLSNLKSCGYIHEGFYKGYRNGFGRFYFLKDFAEIDSQEKLWKSYEPKTRNLIKKAIKLGVKCEELDIENIDTFCEILNSTATRRSFHVREPEYFRRLIKSFNEKSNLDGIDVKQNGMIVMAYIEPKQSIKLLESQREALLAKKSEFKNNIALGKNIKKNQNQLKSLKFEMDACEKNITMINELSHAGERIYISGATFVTFNNEMVYLFSGSDAEYYGLSGAQLVQHYAQTKALKFGVKRYNYLTTEGKHSGANDDGILNFKKGFGGYLVELPGEFHINVNEFLGKILEIRNGF